MSEPPTSHAGPAPHRRAARIVATGPHGSPRLHQRLWPVDPKYTHTLFIPTGRHTVRLNWRNPLAVPIVALVVLLSPLLALWAGIVFVADKVDLVRRSRRAKE